MSFSSDFSDVVQVVMVQCPILMGISQNWPRVYPYNVETWKFCIGVFHWRLCISLLKGRILLHAILYKIVFFLVAIIFLKFSWNFRGLQMFFGQWFVKFKGTCKFLFQLNCLGLLAQTLSYLAYSSNLGD